MSRDRDWVLERTQLIRATAPRRQWRDRWEDKVDPDGALDPIDRARKAQAAKSKHFRALAKKRWAKESPKPAPVAERIKRAEMLWDTYRLALEDYDAILEIQGGNCALCRQPPRDRWLVVDHDHNCCPGKQSCGRCVRGLLHHECNMWVGAYEKMQTDPKDLARYVWHSDPLGRRYDS